MEIPVYFFCIGDFETSGLQNIVDHCGGDIYEVTTLSDFSETLKIPTSDFLVGETDSDYDGIPDVIELYGVPLANGQLIYNCDPQSKHSDGDGIEDGEEIIPQLLYSPITITFDGEPFITEGYYFQMNSDPTLEDTDGDGIMDNEDADKTHAYYLERIDFPDSNASFKKIGSALYTKNTSNELVAEYISFDVIDVWVVQTEYDSQEKVRRIFENEFEKSILIIDLISADDNLINYQVSNSYRYDDLLFMYDVSSLIKDYNNFFTNRERYQRSTEGMVTEWVLHNTAYTTSLGNSENAKHVDLDEYGDTGLPIQIP